jgi:hypothetical protein
LAKQGLTATLTVSFDEPGFAWIKVTAPNVVKVSVNGLLAVEGAATQRIFSFPVRAGTNTLVLTYDLAPTTIPRADIDWKPGDIGPLEAESGKFQAPMQVATNTEASGGQVIVVPTGAGRGELNGKVLDAGWATYTVNVPRDGDYVLQARTWWKNTSNNSLFFAWDDAKPEILGNDETYGQWHWVETKSVRLSSGPHKLTIRNRDENSVLDCMAVVPVRR